MKRKTYRFVSVFISTLLLFSSVLTAYADIGEASGSKRGVLVKEYEFTVAKSDDYSFDSAPDEIKEKGKRYKLKDVQFEVITDNRIEVVKTVYTSDQDEYEKEITYKLPSGEKIKLAADENVNWRPVEGEGYEISKEYKSKESIPETMTTTITDEEGNEIKVVLDLQEIQDKTKTESFSVPAIFYTPSKSSNKYTFNGKVVTTTEESPTWSGYKEDVSEYLGLNSSNYNITGGKWDGAAEYDGEKYVRKAIYAGTKTTPIYTAIFSTQYVADVTYFAYHGEGVIKAIATYEKAFSLTDALMIGAGVAVIALAIAGIIFLLGKRKRDAEKE